MNAISITSVLVILALLVGAIALSIWAARRGNVALDVRQTYFYLVAFVTLLIAFFFAFGLTGQVLSLALSSSSMPSDVFTRQQIAGTLGTILVALPVWWFHWQQSRERALVTKRLLALRIYLYALTIIALIPGVIVGGVAVSGFIKALFGLVDFSSADSVRVFWRDELTAIVNVLIVLIVWFYHWRAVERVPADD